MEYILILKSQRGGKVKIMKKYIQVLLLIALLLIGAVATLYRAPIASAAPAIEVVPGEPIPEETTPETEPTTTPTEEPTEEPEPYRPEPTQPQHVHNADTESVEATCTTNGYVREYCTTCGETLSYTEIPAMGHEYHETSRVEPQIGVDGYIEYTCVRNDDSYRTPLEALPEPEPEHTHVWFAETVAATCTTDGYYHQECMDCGFVNRHEVIEAKGHSWTAWYTVKAATYDECGIEEHKCGECGITEQRSIPQLTRPVDDDPADTEPTTPADPEPTTPQQPEEGTPEDSTPDQPEEGAGHSDDCFF